MAYEATRRLEVRRVRDPDGSDYRGLRSTGRPVRVRREALDPDDPWPSDDVQSGWEVHPAEEGQTKLVSFIESVVNVGSGFLLSLVLWQYIVAPAFGYAVTMKTNLILTTIFTVTSVARGYLWRRFFARNLHRSVVRFVQNYRTGVRS